MPIQGVGDVPKICILVFLDLLCNYMDKRTFSQAQNDPSSQQSYTNAFLIIGYDISLALSKSIRVHIIN